MDLGILLPDLYNLLIFFSNDARFERFLPFNLLRYFFGRPVLLSFGTRFLFDTSFSP
jgi:hypothetical protein